MQNPPNPTGKLLLTSEEELFATIVHEKHPFRRLNEVIDFASLITPMRATYSTLGATGIDVEKGVKALLIQFWENYSDREMEQAVRENLAVRWFCGFSLTEATPDYSYFSKLRKRIGAKRIADMFKGLNATLKDRGLLGNVFAFIDASTIITKAALWEERDRAIKDGAKKMNNKNVMNYAADKDARWGAKSKKKIWFGYKRHAAVDMRHGLITKVAVTPANTPDMKAADSVMPTQGAVFMDKGYDYKEVERAAHAHGCHAAIIRKNNNKEKDYDLDRFRSGIRMPFEGVFSKMSKRARYRGRAKVIMQAFLQAIVYNLKKAVRFLVPTPTPLTT
ncbi:DDE transposase [Candidatus Peregrinibacteria bacterium CG_4_9_14_3_um_filter_49_12]|nr:MAG: DDE transposase [Candidatus Peregrinibacteria bacterium CG_4_9_14_3_um_filter_49_12]